LSERTQKLRDNLANLSRDLKEQNENSRRRREEQQERMEKLRAEEKKASEERALRREEQRRIREEAIQSTARYSTQTSRSTPALSSTSRDRSYLSSSQSAVRPRDRPSAASSAYEPRTRSYEPSSRPTASTRQRTTQQQATPARPSNPEPEQEPIVTQQMNIEPGRGRWRKPSDIELEHFPSKFCPILLLDTNNWVITKCGHFFDEEALTGWLATIDGPATCPVCRKPFMDFDQKAQRDVAHHLIVNYLSFISQQYTRMWTTDCGLIIDKIWKSMDQAQLQTLIHEFNTIGDVNVSAQLYILSEPEILSYIERLKEAVYDIVLKDLKLNLVNNIPACYQSQLNKDNKLYLAYSLTKLVPEFHAKWWRSNYLSLVHVLLEERFLLDVLTQKKDIKNWGTCI